ncbi:protein fam69c-like [Plakobranchus ocellatus]|uniref:Protein fam69c-like n=1 Tax=Plakobranchus ocellatus TaxID=259542 RepID=A0AAV4CBH6_9GAST|nr:protein fam69c-like [Plakobranchus ocellatus]
MPGARLKHIMFNWRSELTKRPKVLIVLLIIIGVILWCSSHEKVLSLRERLIAVPCENTESKSLIEDVCKLYERRETMGELCEPLCRKQNIHFSQCLNYKRGKHVISVQCQGHCVEKKTVPAVLKMARLNGAHLTKHLQEAGRELMIKISPKVDPNTLDLHEYSITSESLSVLTSNYLNDEYGYFAREDQDLLSMVWGEDYAEMFRGPHTNLAFARTYWALLKQNEFRISRVFGEWEVFPKIYSFCGPMYLAQHSPPFKSLDALFPFLSSEFPSWKSRAQLAIQILELVQRMDTMEHPLHLCDTKSPHFGFTPQGQVRFIDSDTVFADEALSRIMSSQVCGSDEDCMFYDCEGSCNVQTGKCVEMRTNNNLQVVCAKVFRGPTLAAYGGLLTSPPKAVAAKLTALVAECATETTKDISGIQSRKPSQDTLLRLQRYLLESLNENRTKH